MSAIRAGTDRFAPAGVLAVLLAALVPAAVLGQTVPQVVLKNNDGATITGYEYRYSTGGVVNYGDWTEMAGSSASTTSYELTGLTSWELYTVQVRARNAWWGAGPESPESGLLQERAVAPELLFQGDHVWTPATPTAGYISASYYGNVVEHLTENYAIRLSGRPEGNVTVLISSSDPNKVMVDPTEVTFTPSNWEVGQ